MLCFFSADLLNCIHNVDLIELSKDKLALGMSLAYTLRDDKGSILLAKGHRIESIQQLDGIRSRNKLFVEIDESEEGLRAMMSGITALNLVGAPIKDFSKYMNVDRHQGPSEVLTGTLIERWGTVESKLGGLLASVSTTSDFESKIRGLSQSIQLLMSRDSTASQFLLFNRAITQFNGYSVSHSLLCAALAQSLIAIFELSEEEGCSLVCAALTMNVAMTRLQDQLALQKEPVSVAQRKQIESHGSVGSQLLTAAGVVDPLWLDLVEHHHSPVSGPDQLAEWPATTRLIKILQTVDRYTAAMSPRKSRVGRTAKASVQSVVVQASGPKLDQVGTALVRILGVSPPGTYVKLANGETAVVMRRGTKPTEPVVASVINRNDEHIAEPRLHDTSKPAFAVEATLVASSIRLNLNMEAMLKLIPK